jgi:hypothetical protein
MKALLYYTGMDEYVFIKKNLPCGLPAYWMRAQFNYNREGIVNFHSHCRQQYIYGAFQ